MGENSAIELPPEFGSDPNAPQPDVEGMLGAAQVAALRARVEQLEESYVDAGEKAGVALAKAAERIAELERLVGTADRDRGDALENLYDTTVALDEARARIAELEAENANLAARLPGEQMDRLEQERDEARAAAASSAARVGALLRVLPECFVCSECGPLVKADEDGCCTTCGRDCEVKPTADALPAPATALRERLEAAFRDGATWGVRRVHYAGLATSWLGDYTFSRDLDAAVDAYRSAGEEVPDA